MKIIKKPKITFQYIYTSETENRIESAYNLIIKKAYEKLKVRKLKKIS